MADVCFSEVPERGHVALPTASDLKRLKLKYRYKAAADKFQWNQASARRFSTATLLTEVLVADDLIALVRSVGIKPQMPKALMVKQLLDHAVDQGWIKDRSNLEDEIRAERR